jgi:hypothetical protein
MEELGVAFRERHGEIEAYLAFLENIEREAQSGPPRIGAAPITAQQQRILYSGVFLQLYNLVEATVVRCLDGVTDAALKQGAWAPGDLTVELRREWVRVMARTHIDMNYENRLQSALSLCDHVVQALPVQGFVVEKGGGGSWDDEAIEHIVRRLGFALQVRPEVYSAVKRKFRDDLGCLQLVKKFRNQLAHGSISFEQCGENVTVGELRDMTNRTVSYLSDVVAAFHSYIDGHGYITEARRPQVATA